MKVVPDAPLNADAGDLEGLLAKGHPTLVVFETADCEPCRRLEPILETVARDYRGRVLVVRVDASAGWLAARHHLSFVPTLTFWAQGEEQGRIRGNPGETPVRAYLDFLLSRAPLPEAVSGPRHALVARFFGPGSVRAFLPCGQPRR
jgi:thioredoxin-like negative regulator of GroEL